MSSTCNKENLANCSPVFLVFDGLSGGHDPGTTFPKEMWECYLPIPQPPDTEQPNLQPYNAGQSVTIENQVKQELGLLL